MSRPLSFRQLKKTKGDRVWMLDALPSGNSLNKPAGTGNHAVAGNVLAAKP
jgi:hypothetical protein